MKKQKNKADNLYFWKALKNQIFKNKKNLDKISFSWTTQYLSDWIQYNDISIKLRLVIYDDAFNPLSSNKSKYQNAKSVLYILYNDFNGEIKTYNRHDLINRIGFENTNYLIEYLLFQFV